MESLPSGSSQQQNRPEKEPRNTHHEIHRDEAQSGSSQCGASIPHEVNEHRGEPEDDDDSGLRPAPLELEEGERQSDARHRGCHHVQEGPQQGTNDEYKDEGLCTLSLGAQEVQDVLEE